MPDQYKADQLRELRGGKSGVQIATEMLEALREAATPAPYPAHEHVLSCPGCNAWQLHYTDDVIEQWARRGAGHARRLARFEAMVESILKEHVARECPQPLLFMTIAKNRGVL